jgi:hypothetical protein
MEISCSKDAENALICIARRDRSIKSPVGKKQLESDSLLCLTSCTDVNALGAH